MGWLLTEALQHEIKVAMLNGSDVLAVTDT